MAEEKRRSGGSRFLYEPFDVASARVETLERVSDERWLALERRLASMETQLTRLEKRIWIAVYGVATIVIFEGVFLGALRSFS